MNRSDMYASGRCPHHGLEVRVVGRPGSDEERVQCDACEVEFQRTLACLERRDVA